VTFDDGYRDNFSVAAPILKRHQVPAIYFISLAALRATELFWWDELAWMVSQTRTERATLCGSAFDLSKEGRERLLNWLTLRFDRIDAPERRLLLQECRQELKVANVPMEILESTFMTPDQVRSLPAYGISVGCHTVSHPCLSRLTPEQQEKELWQCKTELELLTGRACLTLSYPFGKAEHFNADTKAVARKLGFAAAFSLIRGIDRLDGLDPWALCRMLAPADFDSFPLWMTFPRLMHLRQARSEAKARLKIEPHMLSGWAALAPAVQSAQAPLDWFS
jgi:peptidoglycan/xylan/chitin deacetylase (PgdA/CDA1 family)